MTQDQIDDRRNVVYFALVLIAVAALLLGLLAVDLGGAGLLLLIPALGMAWLVFDRVRYYWRLRCQENSTFIRK